MDAFPFVNAPTLYLTEKLVGGGIAAFQVVGFSGTGQVSLSQASVYANFPVMGISLATVANNTFYPFVTSGIITNPSWTFTPGKVVVDNSGNVTQTLTSLGLISVVGYATGPHSIYFTPQGYPLTRISV